MSKLSTVLAEAGSSLTERDVLEQVSDALTAQRGTPPLSDSQVAYLVQHAGLSTRSVAVLRGQDRQAQKKQREAVATSARLSALGISVSVDEAAKAIGCDKSGIYRNTEKGRLVGVKIGGLLRIPRWQIRDGHVVPGLDGVPARVWRQLHPLTVADIMDSPEDVLDGRTPVDWLISGGDPVAVSLLLESHARW